MFSVLLQKKAEPAAHRAGLRRVYGELVILVENEAFGAA
jgi:hypothetical protein